MTLRQLLIQRAARLQERPALTAPGWGTLGYGAWRNRVEGIGLGLLAKDLSPGTEVFSRQGDAWDWAAEVAAACCGLAWAPGGAPVDAAILGGPRFNDEHGRRGYHDREELVTAETPFHAGLAQGEVMLRLQRWNRRLGWDHDSVVRLPLARIAEPEARAALWNALYAGAHAVLVGGEEGPSGGWLSRIRGRATRSDWDPAPFAAFWEA